MNRISNSKIKQLYKTGNYSYQDLANMANISRERIRQILTNNAYAKLYDRKMIKGRRIQFHRWVMEKHLGRRLRPDEIVHHKNGKTHDNRLINLEIVTDCKEHFAKHLVLYQRQMI